MARGWRQETVLCWPSFGNKSPHAWGFYTNCFTVPPCSSLEEAVACLEQNILWHGTEGGSGKELSGKRIRLGLRASEREQRLPLLPLSVQSWHSIVAAAALHHGVGFTESEGVWGEDLCPRGFSHQPRWTGLGARSAWSRSLAPSAHLYDLVGQAVGLSP